MIGRFFSCTTVIFGFVAGCGAAEVSATSGLEDPTAGSLTPLGGSDDPEDSEGGSELDRARAPQAQQPSSSHTGSTFLNASHMGSVFVDNATGHLFQISSSSPADFTDLPPAPGGTYATRVADYPTGSVLRDPNGAVEFIRNEPTGMVLRDNATGHLTQISTSSPTDFTPLPQAPSDTRATHVADYPSGSVFREPNGALFQISRY